MSMEEIVLCEEIKKIKKRWEKCFGPIQTSGEEESD